jgi:hypothetical protein
MIPMIPMIPMVAMVATTGAAWLAAVLVAAQGLAAIELLAGVRRLGLGCALAAAAPLGLVCHGTLGLLCRLGGIPPSLRSAAVQAGLLGLAALLARRFRPPAPPALRTTPGLRPGEIAAGSAIVAVLLVVAATAALEPPVEWDVLAIWGFKARVLAAPGDWLAQLRDPAFAYAHPDYPLAWPLALALEPAFASPGLHGGGGLLGWAMLASAAGLAAVLVRPWGRRAALAAAALVATLPMAGSQAVRGLADLPLAALLLVAAGSLAGWLAERDAAGRLALAATATAGLLVVKQEGIALAVALAGVALLRTPRAARGRLASALALAFLVIALPWLLVRSTLPAGADNSFADMTVARAAAGLTRLPEILAALPLYLGAPGDWGALWPLVLVALAILAADRDRLRQQVDLACLLAGATPLYLAALLADRWEPARLAEVALSRLALHFAPLAAALAVAVAAQHGVFGSDPTATHAAGTPAGVGAARPGDEP